MYLWHPFELLPALDDTEKNIYKTKLIKIDLPEESNLLIWVLSLTMFLIVIAIVSTFVYCWRKKKRRRLKLFKNDGDKKFDVFISYSHLDKVIHNRMIIIP